MPLATRDVIGILTDNLQLRGSVLPLPRRDAVRWTRGLGLRRGGHTVLYTGMMYQLIPYIEGLVKAEKRLGDSFLARYTALGRRINRLVNVSAFMVRPSRHVRRAYDQIPIDVARLLQQAGVDFGVLFEDDLYTGALAHDLGGDEVVLEHAKRVHAVLRKHGVERVITIDPHTTTMLRSVYPKILDEYDLEVKTYLEVLVEKGLSPRHQLAGEVVLHDPCVFARSEDVLDEPRHLLEATGLTLAEPEKTGRMTWCCGGPVEALYPEKARANAEKRAAQLGEVSRVGVTMCPMCLVNLAGAAGPDMTFHDISQYLKRAYLP